MRNAYKHTGKNQGKRGREKHVVQISHEYNADNGIHIKGQLREGTRWQDVRLRAYMARACLAKQPWNAVSCESREAIACIVAPRAKGYGCTAPRYLGDTPAKV